MLRLDQTKSQTEMMIGSVGKISVLAEISCLRFRVYLTVLVCGAGRYYSLSITGVSTRLGLLISGRTVKVGEIVYVAGDVCFVRSQLSSCATRLLAVIVANIHSSLAQYLSLEKPTNGSV